ncbi:hypothetical protein [Fuchsiella alkaliacetigena]|uniref:hypothetical protein n=1 Tax=Fuchsiella alkaliacetigena TaxID=957042 RepID=UPI00200AEF46|nr:hypothetical protein [Fuchsiella alkaliacetigena]MCK8826004.1 hypothetical protein [Fuchsiella alkaliacetigena]
MDKKSLVILEEDDLAKLKQLRQKKDPERAMEFLEEVIVPKVGKKSRCLEGKHIRMK